MVTLAKLNPSNIFVSLFVLFRITLNNHILSNINPSTIYLKRQFFLYCQIKWLLAILTIWYIEGRVSYF